MKRLIIGCGYLGRRVAERWTQAGDEVHAMTRSAERGAEFAASGWQPVIGDVTAPETLADLPAVDTLLFAVGMDRSRYTDIRDVYVRGLERSLAALPDSVRHVVYISSTGVYGDFGGDWVDENSPTDPKREGGRACLEAEKLLLSSPFAARSTVLRLAGIYGPDRVPTRQQVQEKQRNKLSPQGYLNLIHVHDAAKIVQQVAESNPAGENFLVSDGQPPLRRDYYDFIAERFSVGPIPWDPNAEAPAESRASSSKRISNAKLMERFSIELKYPSYREGLRQAFGDG